MRKLFRLAVALALAAIASLAITSPAHAWTWRRLDFTQQAQQYSNWCWAATGNSVAAWYGYDLSQNQFCNLAFNRAADSACPNNQATLANDQNAFRKIGISPGNYVSGYLTYAAIVREIDADRPIMARIQWTSGGGHMEVLYGYDKSQSLVYWSNPWPSSTRYNWTTYDYYVSNGSFFWTHSLDYIGA
ncbi:papain-like cysteine protease family protein [Microtetraspora fusca]|uniref:Papain-like cysteine protease family protein n=1 Tax=Microtetraspora fusca TaxID=1997 RepID=A0ABW6UY57_MICFU|nr:papain-like cysteine protease family protein [Microtetraspora fusca]